MLQTVGIMLIYRYFITSRLILFLFFTFDTSAYVYKHVVEYLRLCLHVWNPTYNSLTLSLTLCGLTGQKTHREAQGSADQSMKKPILVSFILLNEPLKALMLVASTARWSSWFHLYI